MPELLTERNERAAPVVVTVRPLATPLSLGFLSLAVMSFVVSGLELSWVDQARQAHTVALVALVFVVPLQLMSTVFGFLCRDPAAAAGMGILAGTWAAYGGATLESPPGSASPGLGLLLLASAVALLSPIVASVSGKALASGVLLIAATRFALSGVYELTGSRPLERAAGAAGLAVAALALYAALAFEMEGAFGRAVLPLARKDRGRIAVQGTFAEQMRNIEHEPGVRRPL